MNAVAQAQNKKTGGADYICSALLLLVVLCCLSAWHQFFDTNYDPERESRLTREIAFHWFLVPYATVIAFLVLWPLRMLGKALALGTAFVMLLQFTLVAAGGILFMDKTAVRLAWVVPLHLLLGSVALVAIVLSFRPFRIVNVLLLCLGLVGAYVYDVKITYAFLTNPGGLHMAAPQEKFPSGNAPVSSLILLNSCLWYYYQNSPTGFPADINQFHQTMECSGTEPIFTAQSQFFVFAYSPAPADGSGKIERYSILMEYDSPYREYKYSLYTDDTGIVHRDGQHATPKSPAIPAADQDKLLTIIQSLKKSQEERIPFPATVPQPPAFSVGAFGVPHNVGYRVTYKRGPSGMTFTLQARPLEYGINATRSYFLDQQMVIHGTPADTPASASDPIAWKCEFYRWSRCTADPWTIESFR